MYYTKPNLFTLMTYVKNFYSCSEKEMIILKPFKEYFFKFFIID